MSFSLSYILMLSALISVSILEIWLKTELMHVPTYSKDISIFWTLKTLKRSGSLIVSDCYLIYKNKAQIQFNDPMLYTTNMTKSRHLWCNKLSYPNNYPSSFKYITYTSMYIPMPLHYKTINLCHQLFITWWRWGLYGMLRFMEFLIGLPYFLWNQLRLSFRCRSSVFFWRVWKNSDIVSGRYFLCKDFTMATLSPSSQRNK